MCKESQTVKLSLPNIKKEKIPIDQKLLIETFKIIRQQVYTF